MSVLKHMPAQDLFSIHDFASELDKLPAESFREIQSVYQLMRTHPVNPETLNSYLNWDKQHYTRNLIRKTELYELIAICWEEGQNSSIHNHHEQNCWMAAPIGRLLVQNYRVLFEQIDEGRCALETADTVEMNAAQPAAINPQHPVHKVYNPPEYRERAVSLHVYSRPFDSCVVYSQERGTCGVIKLEYTTQYGGARTPART